jgi:hypothetical protein
MIEPQAICCSRAETVEKTFESEKPISTQNFGMSLNSETDRNGPLVQR